MPFSEDGINEQLASGEPYRDMSTMSMAVRAGRLAKLQASAGTNGHYRDRAYHQHRVRELSIVTIELATNNPLQSFTVSGEAPTDV